jgi:flagellar biosynthesis protein FlhG
MAASERPPDQAEGLRRMRQRRGAPVRVLAVASGKGGVGKTNVSVNLSIALSQIGRRVMLLDADLSLGNVDVLLGLHPVRNLSHVLDGTCSLEEIIVDGPAGVRLVPASSGARRMLAPAATEHAAVINAFGQLHPAPDVLVVDSAAGISDSVTSFTSAAQEVVVVVCDEPASITDAYALIKVLSRDHGRHRFRILPNMVRSEAEARELFMKLTRVTDRFLSVSLDYMGSVPFDDYVHKAVQRQKPVMEAFPRSRAALAFKKLATVTDKWPEPESASGHLEFFVERLIHAGYGPMEMHA